MNKIYYIIIIALVVLLGCDDFFEDDLESEIVTLNSPADKLVTSNSSFTFWWNELDGASNYNLQIVSPDFNTIEKLVLDTNLTSNQFDVQLYPGDFEWRVKAYNGSSETAYSTYSLFIDSTLDLSTSEVILISPLDESATNEISVDFTWDKVYNATDYTIKIRKDNWDSGEGEKIDETNNLTNYTHEFSGDGTYVWGIMATNSNSSSQYSKREITIDRVNPDQPNIVSPSDEEVITGSSISFNWTRNSDNGSAISETILIDTTETFGSAALKEFIGLDSPYEATSLNISAGETKVYYWKIKSVDKAGNESEFTEPRKVTLKNE